MAFDFLDVSESVVAKGLEGKIIMIYGGNNLGKTKQGTKFPKAMFMPLENGLNAIGGIKKLKVNDWASFKDFTITMVKEKQLYERQVKAGSDLSKSKFHQFKQMCETLCVDSVTALGKSCEKYIVDSADKVELYEGNRGQLYQRFENEFYRVINDFMNLGFTILFIAHEDNMTIDGDEGTTKKIPKGNWKRVIKPIIDRCDVVAYLQSNGVDEEGNVIPSSAYLAETEDYFARTKWDNMVTVLKEFSAESLKKALEDAINEQEANGEKVGTFEDQTVANSTEELDFDEIKSKISESVTKIYTFDKENVDGVNMQRYYGIVKEQLGDEGSVQNAKPKQIKALALILSQVEDLVAELGV